MQYIVEGRDTMLFTLKQFDYSLLTFKYIDEGIKGQRCEIVNVNTNYISLLPIGFVLSDEGVMSWLKRRVIPKNREFVDSSLAKMGLSHNDTIAIIKRCKGLSLNDSYWVVDNDFEGAFSDYNLYENTFEKTLASVAYTGYGRVKVQGFTSSPEFTTNGMLRKG